MGNDDSGVIAEAVERLATHRRKSFVPGGVHVGLPVYFPNNSQSEVVVFPVGDGKYKVSDGGAAHHWLHALAPRVSLEMEDYKTVLSPYMVEIECVPPLHYSHIVALAGNIDLLACIVRVGAAQAAVAWAAQGTSNMFRRPRI